MKMVVIGPGAIGGVTAAFMARAGLDVTLVCRRQSTAETIRTTGVLITGRRGTHRIPLKAVAAVSELTDTYDCCLIATKAYDLEAAARAILPYLTPEAPVVSLQNGICTGALAEVVGPHRTVGAVITWSSTLLSDARLEITGEGGFIIGRLDGSSGPDLEKLRDAMSTAFPTAITDNILGHMFSKLIINSGITCGGAMTGQTLGRMLLARSARRFFIEIVREDLAVAKAMGLSVPPFGGRLDYDRFLRGTTLPAILRRHLTLLVVGLKYRKLKSSSLTALLRGGKTEVDTLNGWIVQKGRELGVPTPVNARVVQLIKEIEAGKRRIAPGNLAQTLDTEGK